MASCFIVGGAHDVVTLLRSRRTSTNPHWRRSVHTNVGLPGKLLQLAIWSHLSHHKSVDRDRHFSGTQKGSPCNLYVCICVRLQYSPSRDVLYGIEIRRGFTMSCTNSVEVAETAPTALQPGFSFAVAFEALHSRLALELRKKCQMMVKSGDSTGVLVQELPEGKGVPVTSNERYLALHKQINEVQSEVQLWRANMGEMLSGYERRKSEEFARLREESEKQVLLARHHAEQQVECVKKLHAVKVHELYDVFMQVQQQQPITEEFLASIQTRTNLQLQEVVETQQQQIQDLEATNFLSHLKNQNLEVETAGLKLALLEKEDILASMKTEVEELIPKLHGYIDAREHLLTMTLKEKTREAFQKLELLLRNEQRENAWMQRALKENKRKRADRLSRLQQQVMDLTATVTEKDDIIKMLERGFCLSNLKDAFPQWQPETTIC